MQILASQHDSTQVDHQPCKPAFPRPPCAARARSGSGSPEGSHKPNTLSMLHTCNVGLPRIHSPDLCLGCIYIWVINKVCGLPFSPIQCSSLRFTCPSEPAVVFQLSFQAVPGEGSWSPSPLSPSAHEKLWTASNEHEKKPLLHQELAEAPVGSPITCTEDRLVCLIFFLLH